MAKMAISQQFQVTKSQFHTTLKDKARQCLQQTVQAYEEVKRALSITQAAWLYTVSKTTLYNKINGCRDQVLYITLKQRLTPEKEKFLQNWVLQL